jgi:integrase
MKQLRNKVISVFPHGSADNLYFEYHDNEGKKRQKSTGIKSSSAGKKQAWRLVPKFENRLKEEAKKAKEKKIEKKEHPLSYYGKKHIDSLLKSKHTKAKTNKNRMKRVISYFGEDKLPKEITELEIEEFFEQLEVTRDTKSDWKVLLTAVFEKARKDRAIPVNILKQFELSKNETQQTPETTRMPYSTEEIGKLINHADRRLKNYLGIAFYLGMRPEEILGLMINDIDFKNNTIYIKRVVVKGEVKPITKQKGGERDVPLFSDALPYIKDQISWAKEMKSLNIFFDQNGERLNDSSDIRGKKGRKSHWNEYLKKLNITPIRRMMNTRHTFAVHCIRNMESLGISINDIATMMGHSSLRMIISHYGKYMTDKNKMINRNMSIYQDRNKFTDYSTDSMEKQL